MVTSIKTAKPTCSLLGRAYVTGRCSHGSTFRLPLGCNDYANCDECLNAYMGKIRARISSGIDGAPYSRYQFLTFTLCRHSRTNKTYCLQCRQPLSLLTTPNPASMLLAWRSFRRWYNRNHPKPLRFFRILEPHRDGNCHLHAVIDATQSLLPLVSKARQSESLRSYYSRQTEDAQQLILKLCSFGFGPIADVQYAYGNGHGAAKYLTWYLGKEYQARYSLNNFVHDSGRRVRLYDTSNDWQPRLPADKFTYAGQYTCDHHEDDDTIQLYPPDAANNQCDECRLDDAQPSRHARSAAIRKRMSRWIEPVRDIWQPMVDTFHALDLEYQRAFRRLTVARLEVDSLVHLVIPQPYLLEQARLHLQLMEDEQAVLKHRRETAVDLFRERGYHGPVGLIQYCARKE